MMKFLTENPKETAEIARKLAVHIKAGDTIAYTGSMGMGKTMFTSALVEALGGDDCVSSPTFSIMNEYETADYMIYHFDMFRITSVDDLYSTGYFDFLDGKSVCIIEWSENIEEALPRDTIKIDIQKGESDNSRIICISGAIFDGGERL